MDISSLLTDLLSGGNVKEISKESGATQKDVKNAHQLRTYHFYR